MAVFVTWSAARARPLTNDEEQLLRGLAAAHDATFPFDAAPLHVAVPAGGPAVAEGSTNLPSGDPFATVLGLAYRCRGLTDLRRALPDATWTVHLDGDPVPWDDEAGYGWPEQHDPAFLAELEQMRAAR
jgi:hypothetical protein